jgi:uncharacterized protein
METSTIVLISFLFLLISFLYSTVGFGGGSSYLAILSLFITDFNTIRTHALLCNIVVVTIGCVIAYRKGFLSLKKAIPYTIFSVPAALWGATFKLSQKAFFLLLSGALILSAVALFFQVVRPVKLLEDPKKVLIRSVPLGTGLGFLSGMVGIGGGIFLSPVLNLLNWEHTKNIAGIAGFFYPGQFHRWHHRACYQRYCSSVVAIYRLCMGSRNDWRFCRINDQHEII